MKRYGSVNPILIELIVVILFFALSASVIVRVIGTANAFSTRSSDESNALVALEDMAERIKADPAVLDYAGGLATLSDEYGDMLCTAKVTRERSASGAYYTIILLAERDGEALLTLNAARYVPSEEVTPHA